jgi:hypothetical protein
MSWRRRSPATPGHEIPPDPLRRRPRLGLRDELLVVLPVALLLLVVLSSFTLFS